MPKAWSNKDERMYEHVKDSEKDKGGRHARRAKEIAARTVNKQRSEEGRINEQHQSSKSHNGRSLDNKSKSELYQKAKKEKISGRSKMTKGELVEALRS